MGPSIRTHYEADFECLISKIMYNDFNLQCFPSEIQIIQVNISNVS